MWALGQEVGGPSAPHTSLRPGPCPWLSSSPQDAAGPGLHSSLGPSSRGPGPAATHQLLAGHSPFRSRQSMRCPRSVNSWGSRVDGG